jgi:WD40 repeat protein
VTSGLLTRSLTGHTSQVSGVAFSADGTRIASGNSDGTVKIWDVTSGLLTRSFTGHTAQVSGVAFSPDGTRLASASLVLVSHF